MNLLIRRWPVRIKIVSRRRLPAFVSVNKPKKFKIMNLTPESFLQLLKEGKTEKELNRRESDYIDPAEFKKLTSKEYGHTPESARDHLLTDYSNGFTICSKCGSFYHLGEGFTKHLSNGCLNCEGEEKHRVYWVNQSQKRHGEFPARFMAVMFDDGMHYCKDKLQVAKYADQIVYTFTTRHRRHIQ